jgi:hypothetical protein
MKPRSTTGWNVVLNQEHEELKGEEEEAEEE